MPRRGIFRKIFRSMLLISLLAGATVLVIVVFVQTRIMEKSLVETNTTLAKVTAKMLESGYLARLWPFETLKKIREAEEILFVWIVKPNGEIFLADNPAMEGRTVEYIVLAGQEPLVMDSRYQNQRIKLIIHPLRIEVGGLPWGLYLGASLKPLKNAQKKTLFTGLGVFLVLFILATVISFYASRELTRPLEELGKGATMIGKGNLKHRIHLKTGDEIEELGTTLNKMADELHESRSALEESKSILEIRVKSRTKELQELTEALEGRVKERTKELQQRIDELERFHRLTVGRELKMIELKKTLQATEERIKKLEQKGRKAA